MSILSELNTLVNAVPLPVETGAFWRLGCDLYLKKLENFRSSDCIDAHIVHLRPCPECRDSRYYGTGERAVHACRQPLPL